MHADAKRCFVSGYIAAPSTWQVFEFLWNKVLANFGVRAFHARLFFNRQRAGSHPTSPYDGWSGKKAVEFIRALTCCIYVSEIHPIGGAVDIAAFWALSYGERRYLTGGMIDAERLLFTSSGAPGQPYHAAMQILFTEAMRLALSDGAFAHFVFAEHQQLGNGVKRYYDEVKPALTNGWVLGDLTFSDPDTRPGLQAADLFAYAWQSYLTKGLQRDNKEMIAALAGLLSDERRKTVNVMGADDIAATLGRLNPSAREWLHGMEAPRQRKRGGGSQ